MGLQGLKALTLGKPDVFKGFVMFLDPPTDQESDSALAELLSGNTLADESSLLRWMLFALVIYTIISDFSSAIGGPLANPKPGTWFQRPGIISAHSEEPLC